MPTYEYRCPKGHTFELFHRMSDDSPTSCEVCGATPVERILFAPPIHFKGSGFYSTDYGRKGKKRDGGGEGGSDAKTGDAKPGDTKKADTGGSGSSAASESAKSSGSGGQSAD
jgi:putative FmdB family regulatory protein